MERVLRLAQENPVVVFSHSSCGMCHSINILLSGYGGNPAVYELDKVSRGAEMERALRNLLGRNPPVPAVFVGGRLIGQNQDVIAVHMSGRLKQLLIDAGFIFF